MMYSNVRLERGMPVRIRTLRELLERAHVYIQRAARLLPAGVAFCRSLLPWMALISLGRTSRGVTELC